MYESIFSSIADGNAIQTFFDQRDKGVDKDNYYFTDFFPWRFHPHLSFKSIQAASVDQVVADIVSYGSSAPEKRRQVVDAISGNIPPIRVKRVMNEDKINEYNIIKAAVDLNPQYSSDLLDFVFDDLVFCERAVLNQLDYLSCQAISQGAINLTTTNNESGVITQTEIDFAVPSDQKTVCSAANRYWTTATTSTMLPITDIQNTVEAARAKGIKLNYVVMNQSKFLAFRNCAETKDLIYGYGLTQSGLNLTSWKPSAEAVNGYLKESGLPQIIVVDKYVSLEDSVHTQTSIDIFENADGEDRMVAFLPDLQVGNMLHAPIAEQTHKPSQAKIHVLSNKVLLSKWSEIDPIREFTSGSANSFPSYNSQSTYILDTESHTTWNA